MEIVTIFKEVNFTGTHRFTHNCTSECYYFGYDNLQNSYVGNRPKIVNT